MGNVIPSNILSGITGSNILLFSSEEGKVVIPRSP
jgi:hypothetical protein